MTSGRAGAETVLLNPFNPFELLVSLGVILVRRSNIVLQALLPPLGIFIIKVSERGGPETTVIASQSVTLLLPVGASPASWPNTSLSLPVEASGSPATRAWPLRQHQQADCHRGHADHDPDNAQVLFSKGT